MSRKEEDIHDVMREERSRGKRPVDTDAEKQQRERLWALRQIIRFGTRDDLAAALREWGYSEGEIEKHLRAFDDARQPRRR